MFLAKVSAKNSKFYYTWR